MRCSRVRKHFDALLDGRVSEQVQLEIENHLAACRTCADEYTFRCKIARGLRVWPRPSARGIGSPLAVAAADREIEPVIAHRERGPIGSWVRNQSRQQLMAAALLLIGLGVTHILAFWLGDARTAPEFDESTTAFAELSREELPRIADLNLENAEMMTRIARYDHDKAAQIMNRDVGRRFVSTAERLSALSGQHPVLRRLQPEFRTYSAQLRTLARADGAHVGALAESLGRVVARMRRQLSDLDVDEREASDPDKGISIVVKRLFNRDYAGANRLVMRMIENGQHRRFMIVPVLEGARVGNAGSVEVATRLVEADPSFARPVSEAMQRLSPWQRYSDIERHLQEFMRQRPHFTIFLRR